MRFTLPQLHQLISYCNMMEVEGYYYGNKAQFMARHEKIKSLLESELGKRIAKESENEHRTTSQD